MDSKDDRPLVAPFPVRLHVESGKPSRSVEQTTTRITLGRAPDCDVVFDDIHVSGRHAAIAWEDGQWWVQDLGSKNGTYLDGTPVKRVLLPRSARLQLAKNGPSLHLEIDQPTPVAEMTMLEQPHLTHVADHYFGKVSKEEAGERTTLIRRAYEKIHKKEKKHYWSIIAVVAVLLAITGAALYFQTRRVERLERLHAVAANMFYSMKSLELRLMQLQVAVAKTADVQLQKELEEKMAEQQSLLAQYDAFVAEELGISREEMSEEEWLIYKVARLFGECDVAMPPEFKDKVAEYIQRWKSTRRMTRALEIAGRRRYTPTIVQAMAQNGLPAQFYYLAMQESNFNVGIVGPPTRSGIAKGMWQFIPKTAEKYGLKTGPLVDSTLYDPQDERHNFEKSTRAAAQYLRDLYQTEAQGSGLLVMACYNWGESKILPIVQRMPENPRERNFWNLLAQAKVPAETYDYVFYIVAAAVIGENPRLFGFDFDTPLPENLLATATEDSSALQAGAPDSVRSADDGRDSAGAVGRTTDTTGTTPRPVARP